MLMCDRRKFGGELKCCTKKDSTCFVKVSNNRTRGQTNTICYCDSYCKFTNDCCKDQEKALRICRNQGECNHDNTTFLTVFYYFNLSPYYIRPCFDFEVQMFRIILAV